MGKFKAVQQTATAHDFWHERGGINMDQLSRAKNTPVFRDDSGRVLLPGYTWIIGDYCAPTSIDELSAKVFEHL